MFTFDKAMADETTPLMPVLVLDLVTAPEMREAATVIADVLHGDGIGELDYHALASPSAAPSPGLIHIAAGLYGQNPRPNFEGRGFRQAHWDQRTLDYSNDLQRRSKRARMRHRREQGLPLNRPRRYRRRGSRAVLRRRLRKTEALYRQRHSSARRSPSPAAPGKRLRLPLVRVEQPADGGAPAGEGGRGF